MSNLSVDDLLAELDDLPLSSGQKKPPAASSVGASSSNPRPTASTTHAASNNDQIRATKPSADVGPSGRHDLRHAKSATGPRSSIDDLFDDFGDLPSLTATAFASHGAGGRMAKSTSGGTHGPGAATGASTSASTASANSNNNIQGHSSPTARPPAAKCRGLFLGGPRRPRGRNGSAVGSVHCCDHLRCTKCDFKLIWFFGKEWDRDVDYLFFR